LQSKTKHSFKLDKLSNFMNFLITGGAGFIGSHIAEELIRRGEKVRILDNFSTGKRENIAQIQTQIELIEGDIRSYHTVEQAVEGIDIVIHQAALPSVPRSIDDPITSNEVNINGTLNLLNASKEAGVKRFIFASSSAIYGDNPALPKTEEMLPEPLSPYAVNKLTGESYCKVFSKVYGLHTVSLRYFNVFGPKQDPDSQYSAVIPKFIKLIKENKQPVINGDGMQTRDFIHVSNIVEANLTAATSDCEPGLVLNCACGEIIDLITLVKEINTLTGKNIEPIFGPPVPGDIKHSYADITKIKEKLGWTPKINFKEGLKKLVSV